MPKKPRLLTALGTYSGVGRTSNFKRKAALQKAAKGCAQLDAFFEQQSLSCTPSPNAMSIDTPASSAFLY